MAHVHVDQQATADLITRYVCSARSLLKLAERSAESDDDKCQLRTLRTMMRLAEPEDMFLSSIDHMLANSERVLVRDEQYFMNDADYGADEFGIIIVGIFKDTFRTLSKAEQQVCWTHITDMLIVVLEYELMQPPKK